MNFSPVLVGALFLFIVGFFILGRELFAWYFKINKVIELLWNISVSLKKLVDIKEKGNSHVDIKN